MVERNEVQRRVAAPVPDLSGSARGPDGEAVPDTIVRMHFREEWLYEAKGEEDGSFELVLDAEALASIPEGRDLELEVIADPYLSIHRIRILRNGTGPLPMPELGMRDDIGEITLLPAGAVQGRVLSRTGEVVSGALVDWHPADSALRSYYSRHRLAVRSDANGEFLLSHVLVGTIQLDAAHELYSDQSFPEVVGVSAGHTTSGVTLFLAPADIVTGRVEDAAGAPIAGAHVNGTGNRTYFDTVRSDKDGHFRLALREGSPRRIEAYFLGMIQLSPTEDQAQGAGQVTIVLGAKASRGSFVVRVLDAETDQPLRRVDVARIRPDDERLSADGRFQGQVPLSVNVPEQGLWLDYEPGVGRVLLAADGYLWHLFGTEGHVEEAPHLTLRLRKRPGIRGRLLKDGSPVSGTRIYLHGVSIYVASPREGLVGGRIVRGMTDASGRKVLKRDWYHPEYVLGLDGLPPVDRFIPFGRKAGVRLDDEGGFFFEDEGEPLFRLIYSDADGFERVLGPFAMQKGGLDLGLIEVATPATVTGRFHSRYPRQPERHVVEQLCPERRIPLDSQGRFALEHLEPGDTYFRLRPKENADGEEWPSPLQNPPTYHLVLGAGEHRSLDIDLDSSFGCQLELEVSIAGAAPSPGTWLSVRPLDAPTREFELQTKAEGGHMRARSPALGPCRIDLVVSGEKTGTTRLKSQGPTLDLQAGATVEGRLEFEAGSLRFALPSGLAEKAATRVDLEFEPLSERTPFTSVGGVTLTATTGESTSGPAEGLEGETGPIAPGHYLVRVRNAESQREPGDPDLLTSFEVTIESGKQTRVPPDGRSFIAGSPSRLSLTVGARWLGKRMRRANGALRISPLLMGA